LTDQQSATMAAERQTLEQELERARDEAMISISTLEQQSSTEKRQIISDYDIEKSRMIAEFEGKEQRFVFEITEFRALLLSNKENTVGVASLAQQEKERLKEESEQQLAILMNEKKALEIELQQARELASTTRSALTSTLTLTSNIILTLTQTSNQILTLTRLGLHQKNY
jgi:hypothetical protein